MALKGAGKRPSTCFTSVAGIAQQRLITQPQESEETEKVGEEGDFLSLMLSRQVIRFK